MMDWSDFLLPVLLGLTAPFLNGRAAARIDFWRFCLILWLAICGFILVGLLLDFVFDVARLRAVLPTLFALGIGGLIGYGLARIVPPWSMS
jgi:hypothetical protein